MYKRQALAEAQDIPVCSSMMGLGGFPSDNRLWLGMVGMHGTVAANRAARECDLLLTCGARFSDRVAGSTTGFAPHADVVHMDIDHAEFDKNVAVAVRLAEMCIRDRSNSACGNLLRCFSNCLRSSLPKIKRKSKQFSRM